MMNMSMPAGGANSGSGGAVTVTNSGAIVTSGPGAMAIIAQSIGGGGGLDIVKGNAGSAGGTGTGGPITIDNSGDIVTQGSYAHGIFAQSAGGSGSSAVNVSSSGIILAEGSGSDGIVAQSAGGNISITIRDGVVQGGSGGSAVRIREGVVNTLINYGTLVSKDGPLGNAIIGTTADETINNFGTIAGSVDLGTGSSTFNNRTASWLLPGPTVNLGGTGTLTNQGTVSPGGLERVLTTNVTGNYIQQSSGVYTVDVDTRAGTADRINVSGTTALAGWVAPNIVNKGFALPGTQQTTIIAGVGGITKNELAVVQPSAVARYRLVYPNATDVVLTTSVDFGPPGLTGNQTTIADYISSIQVAGGSASLAPVVERFFYLPTIEALGEALDRLSPAPFMSLSTAATYSNVRFADEMLSCGAREGDHRFAREVECAWTRVSVAGTRVQGSSGNLGYDRDGYSISTGIQRKIVGDFLGGFALSYENSSTDMSDYARSTGSQLQGGVVAKSRWGGTTMALGLTGGYGWYDTKRYMDLLYPGATATSKQGITFLSGRVRLAHTFEWRQWYLRPILDGTINYGRMAGFTESGIGGANLSVDGRSETTISARPALEVGGEISFKNGILARPYIRAGLFHIFSGTSPDITARFEGAPANVPPFTIRSKIDSDMAYVSAGIDVLSTRGMVLRIDYSGLFSGNVTSGTGSAKLSIPF
ncbi:MAG: autotransporter family protein [Syntrophorhabdaceae bacterium]